MTKTVVFLLLGTNLGDRVRNLRRAIGEIAKEQISSISLSSIFKSEPWGFESKNYFLNQCISFYTPLNAEELLIRVKRIEKEIGRKIQIDSVYQDRIIDIDILFFGNEIINGDQLIVPHPRITERRFTLLAMNDLSSEFIHPVFGKSIKDLLLECQDHSSVIKL